MKIAIVYLGRRGAGGPITLELASGLASRGQVQVMLSEYVENLSIWQNSGLPYSAVATYRNIVGALGAWIDHRMIRNLSRQIRSWQPDVLLFPMFYTWNPLLQQDLRDIPAVVIVHDPQPHPGIIDRVYRWLEDRSIRQADHCIIHSTAMQPYLVQRGVLPRQISVIPHGVFSYYKRFGAPENVQPATEPALLFFGRITAYKGVDILLRAYQIVRQRCPARLMLVGAGNLRPYRALLKDLPDVEVVNRWLPEMEIGRYFERARALILPYTSASQSGVLAIAAAYGVPVIATRTGGLPEQIKAEETGLLVSPGSIDELADAMQRLLCDPGLARQLGERLSQEHHTDRNWDTIAGMVYDICERVGAEP